VALGRAALDLEETCDAGLGLRLLLERAALRSTRGVRPRGDVARRPAGRPPGLRAGRRARKRTPSAAWRLGLLESLQTLAAADQGPTNPAAAALRKALKRARSLEAEAAQAGRRGAALEARCLAARLAAALGHEGQDLELLAEAREAERLRLLPLELEALTALARAHLRSGALPDAIAVSREAFQHAAELGRGLPDAQRSALQGRFGALCRVALEVAAAGAAAPRPDEAAPLWLEVLETRQAGALQQALGSRQLLEDAGATQEPSVALEQRARARLEAHAALAAQQAAGDVSDRGLQRLRQQERSYAKALEDEQAELVLWERGALRDARAEALAPLVVGLDELRAALPRGAAYVAYALLEQEAWALVVTAEGAVPRRLCAGAAQMQVLRAALGRLAAATATEGAPSLDGPVAEATRLTLKRWLLEPLALAEPIRTLVVAPDPALVFVPWAWVLGTETDFDVALEPSATAFAWLAARKDPPGRGTLAVGSPAYPDRLGLGASVLRGAERTAPTAVLPIFRPLPFSLEEARSAASRPGDRLLLDEEANEEAFWSALDSRGPRHRWRSLHFAVHGFVDPEHPALALLALAPSAHEDGLLTLAEIVRRRVPADLVVLSACRTARGRVADGEGLLGLCRGFLMAGATQVVASLWDVPDAPTAELMLELRTRLDAGLDAARALREAQAAVRERHPDPAAWAAWVLWGLPTGPGAVARPGGSSR
jgi:CHAT domain-containing protein